MKQDEMVVWLLTNIPVPILNSLTPHKSFKDVYAFVEAVEASREFPPMVLGHAAARLVPSYFSVREVVRLDLALSKYYGKPTEADRNMMEANYASAMLMLVGGLKKPELFLECCEHMTTRLGKKIRGKDMVVVVDHFGTFYLLRDDSFVTWGDTEQTRMPVTAELNAMLGWKDRVEYEYKGTRVIKY